MSSSLYLLLFIMLIVLFFSIVLISYYKKNGHTELYREGARNENEGHYKLALQNYEDALTEIRKLKLDNKFGEKIVQRIKILRTLIDYEKNFETGRTTCYAA
jgi:hypothetical protein